MKTLRKIVAALALGASSMVTFAGNNLLVNGDFEDGLQAAPVMSQYGYLGSAPVGWQGGGPAAYRYPYSVYANGDYLYGSAQNPPGTIWMPYPTTKVPDAASGTHLLAVGTYIMSPDNHVGGLSQFVTVTPGSLLTLSYDFLLNGVNGVAVDVFDQKTQQVIATNLMNQSSANGWTSMSGTFVAPSNQLEVRIHAMNWATDPTRSYLDNVKLTPAVPEASTWSMLSLGLIGLMGLGRQRKASAN